MSAARSATGDTIAAAIGIAAGGAAFFAPALLIGQQGASFAWLVIWAMLWAPVSLLLFDVGRDAGIARLLSVLALHGAGLALLFAPLFLIGGLIAPV